MDRRSLLSSAAVVIPLAAAIGTPSRPADAAEIGATREVLVGQSVQAALDAGPGHVVLAPGTHLVPAPLRMRPHVWLSGAFGATTLRAAAALPAVVLAGGGGPIDRWQISDLVIDARSCETGIDINVVGTTGNTYGEPDSQGRIDNVLIGDATQNGIWYRGPEAHAIITRSVRVRRAGLHAYRIENADSWWSDCEGTTSGPSGAGFYVGGSNLHFSHCKAWYCRGYGWHIRGVRNVFTGCESQDTASHGWRVAYEENTLIGCLADTAGMYDVGGTSGTADGFYVDPSSNVSLTGCLAFDRQSGGHPAQQRYGFNVPRVLAAANLVVGCTGWANALATMNQRP